MLKEMGISSWQLKANDAGFAKTVETVSPVPVMRPDFPIWTLVTADQDFSPNLWNSIQRVIESFGVKTQVLFFERKTFTTSQIEGQLLIGFGEAVGQYFAQEINPLEELRDIIFETTAASAQEIPVIVTYAVAHIGSSAERKKNLWNDLIFARNVYLDTMLE